MILLDQSINDLVVHQFPRVDWALLAFLTQCDIDGVGYLTHRQLLHLVEEVLDRGSEPPVVVSYFVLHLSGIDGTRWKLRDLDGLVLRERQVLCVLVSQQANGAMAFTGRELDGLVFVTDVLVLFVHEKGRLCTRIDGLVVFFFVPFILVGLIGTVVHLHLFWTGIFGFCLVIWIDDKIHDIPEMLAKPIDVQRDAFGAVQLGSNEMSR